MLSGLDVPKVVVERPAQKMTSSENRITWHCHLCGLELFREIVDPDKADVPVTPGTVRALVEHLDRRYERHLRAEHQRAYLLWRLRGRRPKRQWFA